MKIGIVSTFSDNGYQEYGKHFVESCKKYIDQDISVYLYIDNINIPDTKNIKFLRLEPSVPQLTEFKNRNKNRTYKDYHHDGVRFAHKTYATFHAAKNDLDYLIWLDSDTEIYENVTAEYFLKFLPKGAFVGYIGRKGISETGFLIFDMNHPQARAFFERYEWYYNTDAIYMLEEYHDAYIFDVVRKEFEADDRISSFNVSPAGCKKGHFNAAFNGYMVHYKGDDKSQRDIKIGKALRRKGK